MQDEQTTMFFRYAFAESRKIVSIRFYLFNLKSQSIQPFFIHYRWWKSQNFFLLFIFTEYLVKMVL